jgi:hypothetical protein
LNRVLEFSNKSGFTNGQGANVVLGQVDFTTKTPGGSMVGMTFPHGIAADAEGDIWVADTFNSRVIGFLNSASTSTTSSTVPEFPIGLIAAVALATLAVATAVSRERIAG